MNTVLEEKKKTQENKELLKPKIDIVFHALFREENKKLTENLISDILKEEIKVKTSDLNRHINIKVAEQKLGVLDLRTELEDGTKCTIEIQLRDSEYENERFLYYWADAYSRQLERGKKYEELHKTISIIILDHEIEELEGIEELDVKWQIRDNKTGKRLLTDYLEIIIVEIPKALRKYETNKHDRICQWMMFLDNPNSEEMMNIMTENEEIKEAVDELEIMSDDEELRRIAELREKGIRDEYARRQYAIKQGMKQGIEQGIKQGIEQGIKQGLKQEKIEIARNMIAKKIDIKDICEITGLTKEEIENITSDN